jgi:ankyrin repeat protein
VDPVRPSDDDLTRELVEALLEDDLERAELALALGADVNGLHEGQTPLYWAVGPGHVERVKWALAHGACVAAEAPEDGYTSVHRAAEDGDVPIIDALLLADGRRVLGIFDYIGRTPLACAVHKGHLVAAERFIAAGSDVNAMDDSSAGDPPIVRAVEGKSEAMVRLLLVAGADPTLPGSMQLSALHRAYRWRNSTRHPELRRICELLEQWVSRRRR